MVVYKQVPNEVVALFRVDRGCSRYSEWINNCISIDNREAFVENFKKNNDLWKTFLIIIESPHKDEFQDIRKDTKGNHPACGDTGKRIDSLFLELVNKFVPTRFVNKRNVYDSQNDIIGGNYCLAIVNLVPFQCSLGLPSTRKENKLLKNKIINNCISHPEIVDFFKKEVKSFNPDYILNACTSNNKNIVWSIVNSLKLQSIFLESIHPSMWNGSTSFCVRKK